MNPVQPQLNDFHHKRNPGPVPVPGHGLGPGHKIQYLVRVLDLVQDLDKRPGRRPGPGSGSSPRPGPNPDQVLGRAGKRAGYNPPQLLWIFPKLLWRFP